MVLKHGSNIQTKFAPIQPAVRGSEGAVSYHELPPAPSLRSFIYCYWELKTHALLKEPFSYRVVSDGCVDIFFEMNRPSSSFAVGFSNTHTLFPLESAFHYIGVRFLPTMFPQLFGVSASELCDRSEMLADVVPDMANYIDSRVTPQTSRKDAMALLDHYFLARLERASFVDDPRLYRAIDIILSKNGLLQLDKELDTGVSQRQLRRLFRHYIGESPKTFSKVVRFQSVLRAKPSLQSLRENKFFFDAGYYDQAHFIKEFKTLFGLTPGQAFDDR